VLFSGTRLDELTDTVARCTGRARVEVCGRWDVADMDAIAVRAPTSFLWGASRIRPPPWIFALNSNRVDLTQAERLPDDLAEASIRARC